MEEGPAPTPGLKLLASASWRLGHVWLARHLGSQPRYMPVLLAFVTDRCNLQCRMCGVYQLSGRKEDELTTDEWKSVIDSAARLGTMILSFSGGEPLLRPDIFELTAHARGKGMAVHICSNGTSIDAESAFRLQEAGAGTVSISVESTEEETHDFLRGKGSFERAVRGIGLLRTHAPEVRVGINFLICAHNFRNMEAMVPFAESLDVHQIKFAPIHTNLLHSQKPLEDYSYLIFSEKDLPALEEEVRGLIKAVKSARIQTTSTRFLKGIPNLYRNPLRFNCYAGFAVCAVDPRGMVAPCCDSLKRLSVKERPLHEIWTSRAFGELRKKALTCRSACWDTTNTELSIRLSLRSLLLDIPGAWQDVKFYFSS